MTDEVTTSETDLGAPLAGRSVLVTRTREQAHSLVDPLEALGAEVLAMPVLVTVDPEDWGPVDAAIESIGSYDWIVFTSTNGVDRFMHRFRERHGNYDDLASTCMAAVGSATAHRMRAEGFPPAIVPEDFRAEGLVAAFKELGAEKCHRVLIPRAEEAREVLPEALGSMGCEVDVVDRVPHGRSRARPCDHPDGFEPGPLMLGRSPREPSRMRSSTRLNQRGSMRAR